MTKVAVAIPAVGDPTWGLVDSLLGLIAPDGEYHQIREHDKAIDLARNILVRKMLRGGFDWLLFIDKDAYLHPKTLVRLLEWGEPIVGALCFTASKPTTPTVYRNWVNERECGIQIQTVLRWLVAHRDLQSNGPAILTPRPEGSLFEVDATGCHCLLVNRIVFESVPEPWFQSNEEAGKGRGEDLYFCRKVGKAGFPIHVDLSTIAGHMNGNMSIGALDFLAWDKVCDWETQSVTL